MQGFDFHSLGLVHVESIAYYTYAIQQELKKSEIVDYAQQYLDQENVL